MWGLDVIREMNREAAERAQLEDLEPVEINDPSDVHAPGFSIPFLGDACDERDAKYQRVDRLFVDISGWGSEGEPALTQDQLMARLVELCEEHGPLYAALDCHGQFQGWVSVWARSPEKALSE